MSKVKYSGYGLRFDRNVKGGFSGRYEKGMLMVC